MRDDGGRHLWTTPNPAKNLTQTQALSVPILSNHEHFFHFLIYTARRFKEKNVGKKLHLDHEN